MLSIDGERNRVAEGDLREKFFDLSCSMTLLVEAVRGEAYREAFGICF